jgi:hypothetical protein
MLIRFNVCISRGGNIWFRNSDTIAYYTIVGIATIALTEPTMHAFHQNNSPFFGKLEILDSSTSICWTGSGEKIGFEVKPGINAIFHVYGRRAELSCDRGNEGARALELQSVSLRFDQSDRGPALLAYRGFFRKNP